MSTSEMHYLTADFKLTIFIQFQIQCKREFFRKIS